MSRIEAIKLACRHYDYKWPKELWSGVMLFEGYKITIQEFNNWAKNFK
jgi:hypothetical protein